MLGKLKSFLSEDLFLEIARFGEQSLLVTDKFEQGYL